jgi:hypothetical protein
MTWRRCGWPPTTRAGSDCSPDTRRCAATLPAGIDHIDEFVTMRRLWDVGDVLAMEATWDTTRFSDHYRPQLRDFAVSLGALPG